MQLSKIMELNATKRELYLRAKLKKKKINQDVRETAGGNNHLYLSI